MAVPLGVLDLVPVSSGSSAAQALANSRDLVRRAEAAGYHRYWFAEHHLNPGVVGSSPALTVALAAGDTTRIRLGSGAVLAGHRTALSIAEEFALLAAALPGRIDLGLGRSALRGAKPPAKKASGPPPAEFTTPEGLLVPAPASIGGLLDAPRFRASQALLYLEGAQPEGYAEIVTTIQDILGGALKVGDLSLSEAAADTPSDPELWILGSSKGESAALAGARGLRFGANYHVAPSGVLDAVGHYRDSFVPGDDLPAPHITVSADVVVAPTDDEADHLAAGYGQWVASIRTGRGAIRYPSPEEAAADPLPPEEEALVADRVRTRFVGSAERVADELAVLQAATGADELLVTTITHDHEARARSHELLAAAWHAR